MLSLLTLVFLGLGFVVLVLTFLWISHLLARRRRRQDGVEEEESLPEESPAMAMIHGANYGLILGILACALFKILAPLMLILSAAGLGYSGRALWEGVRRYRILVYRALFGLLLSMASVCLHYWNLTESWPTDLIPY